MQEIQSYISFNTLLKPIFLHESTMILKNNNVKLFQTFFKDKVLQEPEVKISIKDSKNNVKECTLIDILGKGGCKIALKTMEGRAIIVPNNMETHAVLEYWERVVEEELKMGQLLRKLNLLCPNYKPAHIILSELIIPAYTSKSFAQMANKKEIFVIDVKNPKASIWKKGVHTIFKSKEEQLIENNWHDILEPFTKDIAKLIMYGIPIGTDSFNIAIVKKTKGYELRYFGFDFTDKFKPLNIPSGTLAPQESLKNTEKLIENLITDALYSIFHIEFESQEEKKIDELNHILMKWSLQRVLEHLKN